MDKEHLRTGDRAACRFRFIKNPEYIHEGTKMIFREGRTKAVGTITKLHVEIEGQSSHNTRNKVNKAQMHHKAQQSNRRRSGRNKGAKTKGDKALQKSTTSNASLNTSVAGPSAHQPKSTLSNDNIKEMTNTTPANEVRTN